MPNTTSNNSYQILRRRNPVIYFCVFFCLVILLVNVNKQDGKMRQMTKSNDPDSFSYANGFYDVSPPAETEKSPSLKGLSGVAGANNEAAETKKSPSLKGLSGVAGANNEAAETKKSPSLEGPSGVAGAKNKPAEAKKSPSLKGPSGVAGAKNKPAESKKSPSLKGPSGVAGAKNKTAKNKPPENKKSPLLNAPVADTKNKEDSTTFQRNPNSFGHNHGYYEIGPPLEIEENPTQSPNSLAFETENEPADLTDSSLNLENHARHEMPDTEIFERNPNSFEHGHGFYEMKPQEIDYSKPHKTN